MQESFTVLKNLMAVANRVPFTVGWKDPNGCPELIHLSDGVNCHGSTFHEELVPVFEWKFLHDGSSKSRNPVEPSPL